MSNHLCCYIRFLFYFFFSSYESFLFFYVYIMFDIKQHQLSKKPTTKSSFILPFFMNYSLLYVSFAPSYYYLPSFISNNFSYDFIFSFFIVLMAKERQQQQYTNTLTICAELSFLFLDFLLLLSSFLSVVIVCFLFSFFTKWKHRRSKKRKIIAMV